MALLHEAGAVHADVLQLLLVAPFERGREQGGPQRATAVAERMEARGVNVHWHQVRASPTSRRQKVAGMARLQPSLVGGYPDPDPPDATSWDIALAAHSFLAPQLRALPEHTVRVTDFHNLEWQHLADTAALERTRGSAARVARALYLDVQVRLLKRFERAVVKRSDVSIFVSDAELGWAHRVRRRRALMLVPSVLPRASEHKAQLIADRRRGSGDLRLVYVGTLRFPPNAMSLGEFLDSTWPAVRQAYPNAELAVAGDCPETLRAEFDRHPGVRALGYVDELGPLLEVCTAAVMPFDAHAGTSLRVLYYGVAGVPVIGTPAAFRGLAPAVGLRASTPAAWVQAVGRLAGPDVHAASVSEDLQRAALRIQRDAAPWDELHRTLIQLARTKRRAPGPLADAQDMGR